MLASYPTINIEVAQNFFVDCEDLLKRYDKTSESFFAVKSRRLKCFNDLRSAYECALKCAIAYHQHPETERRRLIEQVERNGHRIEKLEEEVSRLVGLAVYSIEEKGAVLTRLPVSLRYALDGFDFLAAQEPLYYETIGSDTWLDSFRVYIGRVLEALNATLSKHSGILSAADIPIEKVLDTEYNKYRKA